MARIFYQQDCDLQKLERAKQLQLSATVLRDMPTHLNLKDSGVNVIVGLYEGSKSWAKAEAQGLNGNDIG